MRCLSPAGVGVGGGVFSGFTLWGGNLKADTTNKNEPTPYPLPRRESRNPCPVVEPRNPLRGSGIKKSPLGRGKGWVVVSITKNFETLAGSGLQPEPMGLFG